MFQKIQTLIDQQRINFAEVDYLDLNSAAKVVKDFENPSINAEKSDIVFRESDYDYVPYESTRELSANGGHVTTATFFLNRALFQLFVVNLQADRMNQP